MSILMKMWLFLFVSSFVCYTKQQVSDPVFKQEYQAAKEPCYKETGTNPDEVNAATAQNWLTGTLDEDVKCFKKCMYVKFGVIDQTGEVVDEALQKLMSNFYNTTADTAVTKMCADAEGPDKSDLCSVAYSLKKCLVQFEQQEGK